MGSVRCYWKGIVTLIRFECKFWSCTFKCNYSIVRSDRLLLNCPRALLLLPFLILLPVLEYLLSWKPQLYSSELWLLTATGPARIRHRSESSIWLVHTGAEEHLPHRSPINRMSSNNAGPAKVDDEGFVTPAPGQVHHVSQQDKWHTKHGS